MDKILLLRSGLLFFELLACLTGFIYWRKVKNSHWKWFAVYLAVIFLVEVAGMYIVYVIKDNVLNNNLYRFFGIPLQFLFFFWLFSRYLKGYREKHWPLAGAIVYVVAWIADIAYFSNMQLWFYSFSYMVGNIVLLILILLFFIKFISSEDILRYSSSRMFWVCLGLLIFYLGSLPYFGLLNTLNTRYPDILLAYWFVQISFDYLMYISFSICFIYGSN